MADAKLSALTSIAGSGLAGSDLFYVVDVSATTSGSKSITFTEMLTVFQPYSANLSTLASGVSGGTLSLTAGGTGLAACATGDLLIGTGSNLLGRLAAGSSNNVLVVSGGLPAWTNALSVATVAASGQITSTVTTGTAPFVIASTTEVANLNAAKLQGNAASAFAAASHTHSADNITSGTAAGTIYVTTASDIPNLVLRAYGTSQVIELRNTSNVAKGYIFGDGIYHGDVFRSLVADGTAPIQVDSSTTACTNLNADLLDGSHAAAFATASHTHGLSSLTGDTYSAGQIIRGTGAGGLLSTLDLGTTGQVLTATSGTGLTWTTPSGGGVTLPVSWIGMPSLTGFTPADGDIVSVASTSTTLFTVPTGKNMIYNTLTFHNQNTAATTITAQLMVGTTARVLTTSGSISATSSNLILAYTMVKAGEVLKATSSLNTNVNCHVRGYLVDDTVPLVRIEKFSGWSTGDNTLYTCPSGKIFVAVEATILPVTSGATCVMVYNPSGSARRVILNAVRSGGSPGVSNQLSTASIAATSRSGVTHSYFTLAAGDYISMNVPSTDDYEVLISGYEITV